MINFIKRKRVAILITVLCGIYLSVSIVSRIKSVPYERDEISWYFHTKFFDEAFIRREIFSPLWDGYESFDHPPVSKYIYGAYEFFHDKNYAGKRQVLEERYGRWNFYYSIKSDSDIVSNEFAPILYEMRKVNIVFSVFLLVAIFVLFYMISHSLWYSLVFCIMLSFNSLFIGFAAVITSDSHFLFFSLLAIIFYFRSMHSKKHIWLFAAAILTALASGSKLTGLFLFLAVLFNEIIGFANQHASLQITLKRMTSFILVAFSVWVLINPALYRAPFANTWRYFAFRNFQSANIAYYIPEAALYTVFDRIQATVCTLLVRSCGFHSADGSFSSINLLNVFLFILGIIYCWRVISMKNREVTFLAVWGYCVFTGYLIFLSNYGQRYFVPLQFILFSTQLLGIQFFVQHARRAVTHTHIFHKTHR